MVHTTVEDLLAAYQDQIDRQQALNGTYHPGLAESLSGMAQLLQLHGDHDGAIAAYQRAQHIQRVNDGIYSVSQEPMLRGMISSYIALGDPESVGDHFDQLLWLYGRDYGADDPRLLPLVSEISDWHLQAYSHNPNRRAVQHLVRAHELVAGAIERISRPVGGGNLTVLPLLHNLVVTNYYLADHQRRYPAGSREGFSMRTSMGGMSEPLSQDELLAINSYQNGRRAQESIVATLMEAPNVTTLERVEALAGLGDWYLLFGRTSSAQQAYRQAWQTAEADPQTRVLLPELFGSPRLIALQPTSTRAATDPHSEDAVRVFTRLTVGTRGDVRSTEIVEILPADSEELSSTATRELRKLRFRPRLIDGTMSGSEGVEYTLALQP
ncbi:MAG: tetratricopeptide repeat protein [Bacteroidales bacterium]|nr:tetratricopeptide repeat protein [Bacteroidales bacterium]